MSQIFDDEGKIVPVTLVEAGPCYVTQTKTKEKDGYEAIQIGFMETKKANKPTKGHLKKAGKELKHLKETQGLSDLKVGDEINVASFNEGDEVTVAGVSKGKGFAGAVKRWGFKGQQSSTHGTKHELRTLGSVGGRFPQRVVKGRKMPGRMGSDRVTVKNLKVVKIDEENNIIAIKGALPGRRGTLLEISSLK